MHVDSYAVQANWPISADQGVFGFTTTRAGGTSSGVFAHNNMRFDIGDSQSAVSANRAQLADYIGGLADYGPLESGQITASGLPRPVPGLQWLNQTHGNECIYVNERSIATQPTADAAWTDQMNVGIVIQTADCIPALVTNRECTLIGAAHAGWKGLVDDTIGCLVASMPCPPADLIAWLGPCIGTANFEVGEEVWSQILSIAPDAIFAHASDSSKRHVDLLAVAQTQLENSGLTSISMSNICTYSSPDFYSHRQASQYNGVNKDAAAATGRMASVIYLAR